MVLMMIQLKIFSNKNRRKFPVLDLDTLHSRCFHYNTVSFSHKSQYENDGKSHHFAVVRHFPLRSLFAPIFRCFSFFGSFFDCPRLGFCTQQLWTMRHYPFFIFFISFVTVLLFGTVVFCLMAELISSKTFAGAIKEIARWKLD